MHKCSFPNDMIIKPDGIHNVDPCIYEEIERYSNVTISISQCKNCGNINISWFKQEDTEELEIE